MLKEMVEKFLKNCLHIWKRFQEINFIIENFILENVTFLFTYRLQEMKLKLQSQVLKLFYEVYRNKSDPKSQVIFCVNVFI